MKHLEILSQDDLNIQPYRVCTEKQHELSADQM